MFIVGGCIDIGREGKCCKRETQGQTVQCHPHHSLEGTVRTARANVKTKKKTKTKSMVVKQLFKRLNSLKVVFQVVRGFHRCVLRCWPLINRFWPDQVSFSRPRDGIVLHCDRIILDDDVIHSGAEENVTLFRSACLLYTSPSPRDRQKSRMPSSA